MALGQRSAVGRQPAARGQSVLPIVESINASAVPQSSVAQGEYDALSEAYWIWYLASYLLAKGNASALCEYLRFFNRPPQNFVRVLFCCAIHVETSLTALKVLCRYANVWVRVRNRRDAGFPPWCATRSVHVRSGAMVLRSLSPCLRHRQSDAPDALDEQSLGHAKILSRFRGGKR